MRNLAFNPIFTLRALFLLAFLAYLLAFPVYHEADIVASVLSISFLTLLLIMSLITFIRGRWLRKNLNLSFAIQKISDDPTKLEEDFISGLRATSSLRLGPRKLFPFFTLRLFPRFEEEQALIAPLVLNGSSKTATFVSVPLLFPHRGVWKIKEIECRF